MTPTLLTLIITRAWLPDGWQEAIGGHLGGDWQVNLFFLDQGVQRVGDARLADMAGEKIYCASGHARLQGPQPAPGILPGGLANLGGMMRHSDYTLSLPHLHWPAQPGATVKKQVGILLDDHPDALLEAARLAAGLAGCNHKPILYHATPVCPVFPMAATPYLEALRALGGTMAQRPPDWPSINLMADVIVQL